MRFSLFFVCSVLILFSCKTDNSVDEKLYADYKVRYLSETDQLVVKAKYKKIVGGKTETAFYPEGSVYFEDKEMLLKKMQGITDDYYSFEKITQSLPDIFSIQFNDHKQQLIKHNIPNTSMQDLNIPNNMISLDSGFIFQWEGDTLSRQEEVMIIIEQENIEPLKMTNIGGTKGNLFKLRPEQINKLTKGEAVITVIQRRYQRYPANSVVGGAFNYEYYHPKLKVKVE